MSCHLVNYTCIREGACTSASKRVFKLQEVLWSVQCMAIGVPKTEQCLAGLGQSLAVFQGYIPPQMSRLQHEGRLGIPGCSPDNMRGEFLPETPAQCRQTEALEFEGCCRRDCCCIVCTSFRAIFLAGERGKPRAVCSTDGVHTPTAHATRTQQMCTTGGCQPPGYAVTSRGVSR